MRVQQAVEKQLEETNARWDEERQRMCHSADQANKVSVGHTSHTSCSHYYKDQLLAQLLSLIV